MDAKKKKQQTQSIESFAKSPPNSEAVQKTPNRTQGRIAKRKLHQGGENDESTSPSVCNEDKSVKKRRRSSSASCMTSPATLLKPALTERQQLALLLQMTDPLNQQGPQQQGQSPVVDSSPRDTPTGRSKIHKRNERGETPLHLACIRGDTTAVITLLEQGAEIDANDNAGWTPLHEACNHGHTQVVTILIDKGVNINAAGMGGDTPLHDAVVNNHTEVVKLLLSHGANPSITNSNKQSALDICRESSIGILLKKALSTNKEKEDVFTDQPSTPISLCAPAFLNTQTPPTLHDHALSLKNELIQLQSEVTPSRHSRMEHSRIKGRQNKVNSRGSFYSDLSSSESESEHDTHNKLSSCVTDDKPIEIHVEEENTTQEQSLSTVEPVEEESVCTLTVKEESVKNEPIKELNEEVNGTVPVEPISNGAVVPRLSSRPVEASDTPLLLSSECATPPDSDDEMLVSFPLSLLNKHNKPHPLDKPHPPQPIPITALANSSTAEEPRSPTPLTTPIPILSPILPSLRKSPPILSPTSGSPPSLSSPHVACSVFVMSGVPKRVASIDGYESSGCGSPGNETTPLTTEINNDEDDSVSTVVSFSTSLPIVFGSVPSSNVPSPVLPGSSSSTPALSPTQKDTVVTPPTVTVATPPTVSEPEPDKASLGVVESRPTEVIKEKNDESRPPCPKRSRKSPSISQQDEKEPMDSLLSPNEDYHKLPPKRRISRNVFRSSVVRQFSSHSSVTSHSPIPHNYDSFLTCKHTYRSLSLPLPRSPKDVYPPLLLTQYKLFSEQEQERMTLLASHVNEVDRLVVCFEQELTRAYQKATTTSYPPPSACAVLIERQAISTQYQSTSSINTDTTNTDQLLHSYVQDVWDKYHKCSELLANRHKMEVETLWLSQRQQWMERNTGGKSLCSLVVSHVPLAHTGTFPS